MPNDAVASHKQFLGTVNTYPDTRIDNTMDSLAGVSFADPYQWLEARTDEVIQWQRAQSALAADHVREWPHFGRLRQLVARFSTDRFVALPRYVAGQWFQMRVPAHASQAQAVVAHEPMGEGRILFDPMAENPQRPSFLSWIAPSPDGRTLALGVCADGSENNSIRLIDVATGALLPDPPPHTLMDNFAGGVHWLPDSSGFFFTALVGPSADYRHGVYLHCRSPVPQTELVNVAWPGTDRREYPVVVVSGDGRYAVALERLQKPIPVAVASLESECLRWKPFVTAVESTIAGHIVDEQYIAVTDVGAPRGRLVAIPLDANDPNDPQTWQELIPESDAVLRTVTPIGEVLYLTEFVDTYARVRIVDRSGRALGEIPLPGLGAVGDLPFPLMNLVSRSHPQKFVFAFSSLIVSPGIYSHTPGHTTIETLQRPCECLENAVVEDHWAVSEENTRVPYHLVRRVDMNTEIARPTLIYAYGGFNVPHVPQFPGPMAAFVAAGGVFVHAHLRGGGEFGLEWWQGGRMANKQNCYKDLYSVAEDLIAANRTTSQLLAVTGGSNGGLLAGVAATQRPDLWKVVVPRVPLLDLIGACREAYGRQCIRRELANIQDPEEVHRLAAFSPYHLVREGVRYPAIYLDAGDTDPRCPPWHARKFAARLQQATGGSMPILLRVWENAGHGWATDKNTRVTQNTEWLAFTLRHLGLEGWD